MGAVLNDLTRTVGEARTHAEQIGIDEHLAPPVVADDYTEGRLAPDAPICIECVEAGFYYGLMYSSRERTRVSVGFEISTY
jgi:hypothetical protein